MKIFCYYWDIKWILFKFRINCKTNWSSRDCTQYFFGKKIGEDIKVIPNLCMKKLCPVRFDEKIFLCRVPHDLLSRQWSIFYIMKCNNYLFKLNSSQSHYSSIFGFFCLIRKLSFWDILYFFLRFAQRF